MRAKRPGLIATLFLFLTGKWKLLAANFKTTYMVECVSQFTNGDHLSTQYESPSPFEYGPPIYIEKMPSNTSVSGLVKRHLQRLDNHKHELPHSDPMRTMDLAGMEERWIKGQEVKRDYRRKIGYITEPELQKLLGAYYEKFGDKVRAKLNVLAADL